MNLLKKCFEVLFYRDSKAGDVIQFTSIEKDGEKIKTKSEIIKLDTKWEYKQFTQGNEKNYLVA